MECNLMLELNQVEVNSVGGGIEIVLGFGSRPETIDGWVPGFGRDGDAFINGVYSNCHPVYAYGSARDPIGSSCHAIDLDWSNLSEIERLLIETAPRH